MQLACMCVPMCYLPVLPLFTHEPQEKNEETTGRQNRAEKKIEIEKIT